MLITKAKPVGIDVPIQKLQTYLHTHLVKKWGLQADDSVWACYGRCYRNRTKKGYQAEVYEGRNVSDVYWDDRKTVVSFFGLSNRIEVDQVNQASIHLVFFVNLEKLKPSVTERADEEVRKDVQLVIGAGKFGFTLDSIELWLERCLREYEGSLTKQSGLANEPLAYVDMQPTHVFRLNFTTMYNINIC